MKKVLGGAAAVLGVAILGGALWFNGSDFNRIYVPAGTGIAAKQICSLSFVSGLDAERARALYVDPLLGDVADRVTIDVDYEAGEVTAAIAGVLWKQRAVFREGLGCSLVHGSGTFDPQAVAPLNSERDPLMVDADHRAAWFDEAALQSAIDAAFTDDGRNTLAVLVLHDGRLVAERYADGVTAETPLHGWSMTKSLAATVAGVLVQQGLVDVEAEGEIPALVEAGRPNLTIDNLLRMTGGLAGYELNNGSDPNSDMLFTESDMARFAATREVIAAPGERWDYQSGNTVLAGSGLEVHLGETVPQKIESLRAWLFEPLGMHRSILEADEAGTLQWSSYMYASARDWARLGQLYVNDGRAPDGRQIIPENWINYVTEPTPGSGGDYGSGFWLGHPSSEAPQTSFYMSGFQGQFGYVFPDQKLVVIRLGATNFQRTGGYRFAASVVEALTPPEPAGFNAAPDLQND
jgi:CubicO group peptidase (beta-lactamase class C family)